MTEAESLWVVTGKCDGEEIEVSVSCRGQPGMQAMHDALYMFGKPGNVVGARPATEDDGAIPWVGRVENKPVNPLFGG